VKKYLYEALAGLFFAAVIVAAAFASSIEIPFVYQGF
jgi:hypothetical protein